MITISKNGRGSEEDRNSVSSNLTQNSCPLLSWLKNKIRAHLIFMLYNADIVGQVLECCWGISATEPNASDSQNPLFVNAKLDYYPQI